MPADWTFDPPTSNDQTLVSLTSPTGSQLSAHSFQAAGRTLEAAVASINASIKRQVGADPERTESIVMGGVPGLLLTHHYTSNGYPFAHLDAVCVRRGRIYEIYYANDAGQEAQDHALVPAIVASFTFRGS